MSAAGWPRYDCNTTGTTSANSGVTWSTGGLIDPMDYVQSIAPYEHVSWGTVKQREDKPKSERERNTSLAWLDKRVEEMRIKL